MVPFPPEARSFFHRYPDIGSKPYRTPAVPPGPRGARCGALLWLLLRPPAGFDAALAGAETPAALLPALARVFNNVFSNSELERIF